jgi:large subunit ribosomal protein L32e
MFNLKRNKRKFLRVDAHKMIKLGKGVKKKQRWHKPIGRQNKLRLGEKGGAQRPKVGWGSAKVIRDLIFGVKVIRVENVKDVDNVSKGEGILIAKVGKRKRVEIIKRANERKIKILNRYKMIDNHDGVKKK